MNRTLFRFFLFSLLLPAFAAAQDSIFIKVSPGNEPHTLHVSQRLVYINRFDAPLDRIKLLAWANAYRTSGTTLATRMLEDRKTDLHFAKKHQLGYLQNLSLESGVSTVSRIDKENIFVTLRQPLKPGDKTALNMQYNLKLPDARFTNYGYHPTGMLLKYFFLIPDAFDHENKTERFYNDLDQTQFPGGWMQVAFEGFNDMSFRSDLPSVDENTFAGRITTEPEFLLSDLDYPVFNLMTDDKVVRVSLGYRVNEDEAAYLRIILPKQLAFLKEKLGYVPDKIFLSSRQRRKNAFVGSDDIVFKKIKLQLFTDYEKTDLNYIGILAQHIVNKAITADRNTGHWLYGGLRTYLEMRYLNENYPDRLLLGDLPETLRVWKIHPLKWFHAAKLKLSERYALGYQYIMSQNLDQKIATPLDDLSNFNEMAISRFETGTVFYFLSEKMGKENFEKFLHDFVTARNRRYTDGEDFLEKLTKASDGSAAFMDDFIRRKNRVNFKLRSFKRKDDRLAVKIKKNTDLAVPFLLETEQETGEKKQYWQDTDTSRGTQMYNILDNGSDKIIVNDDYLFPEANFRDNYLYTQGMFANMKKIRLRLFTDIPNPEYNQIFVNPRISWNNYDKLMLGLNFHNKSLFEQQLKYSLMPYYSFGTGTLTGSGGVSYSFMPANSFFRSLTVGTSASYFHYDYNLPYTKVNTYANLNFTKNPRSQIGRSVSFSYSYFQRELSQELMMKNDYSKYNIWNINYNYADNSAIHEKYLSAGVQLMDDFQKLSAEGYYRWEFAAGRKLGVRVFGGYFLTNNTRNNLFDFGTSHVSNYAFSYGLLGQSATTGVLSQQFILAEGGFKSNFKTFANQWIASTNVDYGIWKMFGVYADAGAYKNKHEKTQFIWDSGVHVKVIPEFLEVYLPVQSSLGFEPSLSNYSSRIRFTLNLNLGAVISYFRRGLY